MNVIVRFTSEGAREDFVARTKASAPALLRAYMAKRRPEAVLKDLSDEDVARLDPLVEGLGKVFADVKFETMRPR